MAGLLFAMLAHAGWVFFLYALLTIARARAVAKGSNRYDAYEFTDGEDRFAARVSANLSNQFEAPLLFYVGALLLIEFDAAGFPAAFAAWVFVAGRLIHSAVQILTGDVRLRGIVFTINFLAIMALWALVAERTLALAGVLP